MSRLIDADNFKVFLHNLQDAGAEHVSFENLHKFLDEEPTAYDVDKVVEQLEDRSTLSRPVWWRKSYEILTLDAAIEIVKGGGADA